LLKHRFGGGKRGTPDKRCQQECKSWHEGEPDIGR
jgi:hypothetical protein